MKETNTKHILGVLGLIFVALYFSSCQLTDVGTIKVRQFTLSNESFRLVQGKPFKHPHMIGVSYESKAEHDDESRVILGVGISKDGEIKLTRNVSEPTEVNIGVVGLGDRASYKTTARTTVLLRPDATVDLVLLYSGSTYYNLSLLGADHRSTSQNRRFSFTGNLRELTGLSHELTQVSIHAEPSFLDQSGATFDFGPVLLDEGKFSFEGDLDEPTLFTIEFTEYTTTGESVKYMHAIFEPGVNYRIAMLGETTELAVQADRESVHSNVVSSWQFDPVFIKLVAKHLDDRVDGDYDRENQANYEKKFVRNYQIADECDHVLLTDEIKAEFVDSHPTASRTIGDDIVQKRSIALREILTNTQDSNLARLVFDLSWKMFEDDDIDSESDPDEKLATLLALSSKMDPDFNEQFITPHVAEIERERALQLNNRSLLPGQVAPDFTLTSIAGDEVSLGDVLGENELVLVDFWASWCGPCIASFLTLKKIYSRNKDRGFEIVSISIDDSFEEWETASKELELPWIDLGDTDDGEMRSAHTPTANDYGVIWVPNKFLIDNKGCIVHKHFSDAELKKLLSSR